MRTHLSAPKLLIQKLLVLFMLLTIGLLPVAPLYAAELPVPPVQQSNEASDLQLDLGDYELPIRDFTLSNGLRVVLAQDSSAPVAVVNVTYNVGSANDPQNRSGFAHLFEHLMFRGSAKRGKTIQ